MKRHFKFNFRLYIAGDTQNSAQARANLTTICRDYLSGLYEIEIVDVLKSWEPKEALPPFIIILGMFILERVILRKLREITN